MRDAVAFFVLWLQLPIPLFWLVAHPTTRFWRRYPRACYTGVGLTLWLGMAATLLLPYDWWRETRFSRHPALAVAGAALIAADIWLLRQVVRQADWRVLVGLPELTPRTENATPDVVAGGIYERLRHPRYLGMMFSWWGAVLMSGATRLLWLAAICTGLAILATELEERELLARLGADYAAYRRRVPRFVPRWGERKKKEKEAA